MTTLSPNPIAEEFLFHWKIKDFEENEQFYRKPENVSATAELLKHTITQLKRLETSNEETLQELRRLRSAIRSLA